MQQEASQELEQPALVALELAAYVPRVDGHAHDAVPGAQPVAASVLDAQGPHARLAQAVARGRNDGLVVVEIVRSEPDALVRAELRGERARPDDAHRVGQRGAGRGGEHRGQQLGEEKSADTIDTERDLVALCRLLEGLGAHETGVVEEAVEPLLLCDEALGGGLDMVQVAQVEVEKYQRAR